jgi:mercuric ion transport protein
VTLSRHKNWVFIVSGALIGWNILYVYMLAPRWQARDGACPADAPEACDTASRMSRAVLWFSGAIYCIGAFSAYILGPLLMKFG